MISQTETAHDTLSLQMNAFDELVKDHGGELAEKFARDSGTLGALITRHISEFDRTVKTFGGEIVERMGQRTQEIGDSLKNYVDTFDNRLSFERRRDHRLARPAPAGSSKPRSAPASATSTPRSTARSSRSTKPSTAA